MRNERSDACRNRGLNRTGVNRVRLVMQPQDLGRSGSYVAVTQSPKPTWKHWGPSRRYAPRGAHSTPAPATRDGVTARPIQPRRRASLPAVAERAGRPMARPVRPRLRTAGASPTTRRDRALCKEIASPSGGVIRHTPRGAHVPSTNRSTPTRRNLASVGVGTDPTPNAGKPRCKRRGGCHWPSYSASTRSSVSASAGARSFLVRRYRGNRSAYPEPYSGLS